MSSCIAIPASQRRFQQVTEGLGVAAAPIFFQAAKETAIPKPTRTALGILGLLALVVDGGLLLTWGNKKCISSDRRQFHIATDLLSVVVTAPLSWIASEMPGVSRPTALGLKAISVGTLLIDGWLLLSAWPRN